MSNTTNSAVKNGTMALVTIPSGSLATAAPVKSTVPTGGVIRPMPKFTIMIIPKCTGSTPSILTTGSKMGVRIRMRGDMSIRQPSSSSMMLMSARITYLLSDMLVRNVVTFIGIIIMVIR